MHLKLRRYDLRNHIPQLILILEYFRMNHASLVISILVNDYRYYHWLLLLYDLLNLYRWLYRLLNGWCLHYNYLLLALPHLRSLIKTFLLPSDFIKDMFDLVYYHLFPHSFEFIFFNIIVACSITELLNLLMLLRLRSNFT